jgi:signal transduction histidine kinase
MESRGRRARAPDSCCPGLDVSSIRAYRVTQVANASMATDRDAPNADALDRSERVEPPAVVSGDERAKPAGPQHTFLAVASHELRTPIQALRLNLGMMRTRVEASADEVPRRWLVERLQRTERLVDQMARLVDGLLNMAEISSGRLALRRETFDLSDLAREVVADAEERLRWARSPCDVDAPEPVVGTWDRFRVAMVLENLLANAMKYAAGSPVHVCVRRAARHATLVVADEGPGIVPGDRSRVFEQFERGERRESVGGFGLGLWIVRTIAEAHGGSVALASDAHGATFTVTLPREDARAPGGSP